MLVVLCPRPRLHRGGVEAVRLEVRCQAAEQLSPTNTTRRWSVARSREPATPILPAWKNCPAPPMSASPTKRSTKPDPRRRSRRSGHRAARRERPALVRVGLSGPRWPTRRGTCTASPQAPLNPGGVVRRRLRGRAGRNGRRPGVARRRAKSIRWNDQGKRDVRSSCCRPRALHVGDAADRARGRWFHGVSSRRQNFYITAA